VSRLLSQESVTQPQSHWQLALGLHSYFSSSLCYFALSYTIQLVLSPRRNDRRCCRKIWVRLVGRMCHDTGVTRNTERRGYRIVMVYISSFDNILILRSFVGVYLVYVLPPHLADSIECRMFYVVNRGQTALSPPLIALLNLT
jgi:hypothetical protein